MKKIFLILCLGLFGMTVCPLYAAGDSAESLYQKGIHFFKKDNFVSAIDCFSRALVFNPEDQKIQSYLLLSGQKLVRQEEEQKYATLDNLQNMVDKAQDFLKVRKQQMEDALRKLKAAYSQSLKENPASLLRACRGVDIMFEVSLGRDEDSQKIKDYLHSLCGSLHDSVQSGLALDVQDMHRVMGYIAFCNSEWGLAVEEWEKALSLAPTDERLKFLLSRARDNQAQAQKIVKMAQLMASAEVKYRQGKAKAAVLLLKELLGLSPTHQEALRLMEKTQEKLQQGIRDKAVAEYKSLAKKHMQQDQWLEAAQNWLGLLKIDPLHEEALLALEKIQKNLAADKKRTVQSKEQSASFVSARQSKKAQHHYTLGILDYADGHLKNAVKHFEKSLTYDPHNHFTRRALDRVRREMGMTP